MVISRAAQISILEALGNHGDGLTGHDQALIKYAEAGGREHKELNCSSTVRTEGCWLQIKTGYFLCLTLRLVSDLIVGKGKHIKELY